MTKNIDKTYIIFSIAYTIVILTNSYYILPFLYMLMAFYH